MPTPDQETAFTSGAGGVATMDDYSMTFALIASTLIILLSAWVVLSEYKTWSRGKIELYDFMWTVIRSLLLVIIFGYWIRP